MKFRSDHLRVNTRLPGILYLITYLRFLPEHGGVKMLAVSDGWPKPRVGSTIHFFSTSYIVILTYSHYDESYTDTSLGRIMSCMPVCGTEC